MLTHSTENYWDCAPLSSGPGRRIDAPIRRVDSVDNYVDAVNLHRSFNIWFTPMALSGATAIGEPFSLLAYLALRYSGADNLLLHVIERGGDTNDQVAVNAMATNCHTKALRRMLEINTCADTSAVLEHIMRYADSHDIDMPYILSHVDILLEFGADPRKIIWDYLKLSRTDHEAYPYLSAAFTMERAL